MTLLDNADIERRVKSHKASAIRHKEKCEEMLERGVNPESSEYRREFAAAERALSLANDLQSIWDDAPAGDAPISVYGAFSEREDATASSEYARAFDRYMNRYAQGAGGYIDAHELRTLTIAVDPDGGYTVPADRRSELIRQVAAASPILDLVRRPPTTRDIVHYSRVLPNPASPDIYTSAFVGRMVGEITGGGDAQPVFGALEIPIKKARATCRISMDVAADSEVDMNAFLLSDGAQNLALVREEQILVGDGIGPNCTGVMLDPNIAGVDVEGTVADTISNDATDLGSVVKLLNLVYAVPSQYRADPSYRWVMHPTTGLAIRKLVDGDGSLLLGKLRAELPEFVYSEFMPVEGVDGAKVILAGPLSQIASPDRVAISAQVLLERYADTDEIAVILRARFGVGVLNPRAFRTGVV